MRSPKSSRRFRELFKKSGVLTCSESGRLMRAKNKLQDRRSFRTDLFSKQRNIEVFDEPTNKPVNQRKLKLQQWKEEKERKKQVEKKAEKPAFKVGVFHHNVGSPYKTEASNLSHTRTNKAIGASFIKSKNIKSTPSFNSIAPENFKFKPPVIRTAVLLKQENRTKLEVHKNVKSGTKPNKAQHQEPVISQRMTRSQTKSAQNQELSQVTAEPGATQAKGRRKKLKTPSRTPKPVSQLASIDEREVKESSITVAENTMSSATVRDAFPTETVADISSPYTDTNEAVNAKSDVKDNEMNVEVGMTTPVSECTTENEVVYPINYSPFITKERGSSRRKSSVRKSLAKSIDECMMETDSPVSGASEEEDRLKHGILYFRSVLKSETERLESWCKVWNNIDNTTPDLPQEVKGMISSAIGQTQLLLKKKFKRFNGLIDKCESGPTIPGEPPVICTDLDGFWEMVYLEVEKCDCSFNKLEKLKSNNWIEEEISVNKPLQRNGASKKAKKVQKPTVAASSSLRALIAAARKKQMPEPTDSIEVSKKFTPKASHARQSLLHQAIMGSKRRSAGVKQESSPILTRVSQMIKRFSDVTPNSIPVTPTQVSDPFDSPCVPKEYKTPVRTSRRSILRKSTATAEREQPFKEIQLIDATNEIECKPKSSRKVRFEGSDNSSPKVVQPMTPYVTRRSSVRRSTRLSFLGTENTPPVSSVNENLISFDSPVPEPTRIRRRSVRLNTN